MSLVLASKWAATQFDPSSRPAKATLRRWVRDGEVPGRVIGGQTYVDTKAWAKEINKSGVGLADAVLNKLEK